MESRVLARAIPYLAATGMVGSIVFLYSRLVHVNYTTVALTLLIVVLVAAANWGLRVSVFTSVLAALVFNYFFLPPLLTLTIADTQNWVALAAFLATSMIASNLSQQARNETRISNLRRREAERLYEFTQQMLTAGNVTELLRTLPLRIVNIFDVRSAAVFHGLKDEIYRSEPEFLRDAGELRAAAQAPDQVHEDGNLTFVPIRLGMRPIGAFAVAGTGISRETYDAIGGLIAIAIERAAAVETLSKSEAARESERLRNALLDSVTHELRTPLTSILAAITTLRSDNSLSEDGRRELMSIVEEETRRLNTLITQAVEMAELDTQDVKLDLREEKVPALIEDAIAQAHIRADQHPIETRFAPSLPSVWVDGPRIVKVLLHLLENAAKYSPKGTPIIVSAEATPEKMTISVADRGPGIDELERAMVFDKFYRGESHRYRVPGTGMGLAIARAIVEAHGGSIEVSSQIGHGSVFSFTLPRKRVEPRGSEELIHERTFG
jgi:two-component system, OmpR family, sensor histidine kinase KdpD